MLTRLSTSALLFVCALSLTQFTAAAATLLAAGESDVLVIQMRNSPGPFTTVFRFALPEAASESGSFAFTPMPIVFPEPNTNNLPSDMITFSGPVMGTITSDTANGPREFPMLGKFHFLHLPVLSPYIGAGVSFRHLGGISSFTEQPFIFGFPLMRSTSTTSPTLDNRSRHGGTVGLGAAMRVGLLRISPEIRYTHWGEDRNLDKWLYSNQNQVDFLLGVAF